MGEAYLTKCVSRVFGFGTDGLEEGPCVWTWQRFDLNLPTEGSAEDASRSMTMG